jgi:hypothetical protein
MNKSYVEFGKGKTYQALKKWVYMFESAQRTLAGIEVFSIITKNQIVDSKKSYFNTFLSFVA